MTDAEVQEILKSGNAAARIWDILESLKEGTIEISDAWNEIVDLLGIYSPK